MFFSWTDLQMLVFTAQDTVRWLPRITSEVIFCVQDVQIHLSHCEYAIARKYYKTGKTARA
jgi:hypothetical protein